MLAQQTIPEKKTVPLAAIAAPVAAVTAFAVFLLPLLFPPSHPAMAASFVAGFNNRIAALSATGISFLVCLILWRYRRDAAVFDTDRGRLPFRWFVISSAVCILFTLAFGGLVSKANVAYNDIRYFVEPIDQITRYHRSIYKDFAFLYGPLLLYFPVAVEALLRPFHVGIEESYIVALAAGQTIGLLILYYVVNALPMRRSLKVAIYLLYALQTLSPLLGLNYSYIRGAIPFALLVMLAGMSNIGYAALLAAAAEMLALAVSPEVGIAFAGGAGAYALVKAFAGRRRNWRWLAVAVTPAFGAALFIALAGHNYLDSLALFSRGALNLIVEPVPYILLFLFALVWLAPSAVASRLREHASAAPLMAAFYVAGLALVSPAFGRCDPLHVMFNGLGIYLLAMVAISGFSRARRIAWVGCFSAVMVFSLLVNYGVYWQPMGPALHWALFHSPRALQNAAIRIVGHPPHDESSSKLWGQYNIDIPALESYVGHAPVATPLIIPYGAKLELERSGHYVPDYDVYLISVCDAQSEEAKARRMERNQWALVPAGDFVLLETPWSSEKILGFGFDYPQRNAPYPDGMVIREDLVRNWKFTARIGAFNLYRNLYRRALN